MADGKPRRLEPLAPAQPDDAELVAACGAGARDALSQLFDRFHQDVYRFLSRMVGRHARDVDDLVQTTFLEVARAARRFRGSSQVKTWILGIAANVARHFVRDEARRQRLLAAVAAEPLAESPTETAARRDRAEQLRRAVAELPHELRVAFVMCAIEGISGAEAAAALRVPVGTIWRRLHEARLALSAELQGGSR